MHPPASWEVGSGLVFSDHKVEPLSSWRRLFVHGTP